MNKQAARDPGPWLLVATFVLAISGLVYELIAGTASSYLLGDSVYHFSLVIGVFMTAMGLGAYLSRHVESPENGFVLSQIALSLVGGFSAIILFTAFAVIENYQPFLLLICIATGALVGLEIPLIIRILEGRDALKVTISNVLTADYVGALVAALLFPLVLAPRLGLIGVGLLFGALNLVVAVMALWLFRSEVRTGARLAAGLAALMLGGGAALSGGMVAALETRLYQHEVIHAEDSPYQRVVVTADRGRVRLFLNASLQFDSRDEYRYHESLVHPVMTRAPRIANVLIMGGGDGMAAREALKYPGVESVTLVDLDPAVTRLFRENAMLAALNDGALKDPRLKIINADAWEFLKTTDAVFDVAILDLPDPKDLAISKLYTRAFYTDLADRLAMDGLLVTQATSPLYARSAFWSIEATLAATPAPSAPDQTLRTLPYHAHVPSFGEWGFVLAGAHLPAPRRKPPEGLKFLTDPEPEALFDFPADMSRTMVTVNTLLDHPLPRYYQSGWSDWYE